MASPSSRLTILVDEETGDLIVAHDLSEEEARRLGLHGGHEATCARPVQGLPPPMGIAPTPEDVPIRVAVPALWHGSLIEGPGRRSVVALQGCATRCDGCSVPWTWRLDGGAVTTVAAVAEALLDPAHRRDGVTVLGGEPLLQPEAVAALIAALRRRGCRDIGLYTGFTLAALQRRAGRRPAIAAALAGVAWIIDGPYRAAQADHAPAWRGSRNQRYWRQLGDGRFAEAIGAFGDHAG
jgi:anaerobic ribonucleoside-triphosphate reductase activating protein